MAALAATMVIGMLGCGGGGPPGATSAASPVSARGICAEGFHELLTVDRDKIAAPTSAFASSVAQATEESLQIDSGTEARLRRLARSREVTVLLAYLAQTRRKLKEVAETVRRHGSADVSASRGLALRFMYANSGCGVVKTSAPSGG